MFDTKKAKKLYELARLETIMAENQRRLQELHQLLNGPCPACRMDLEN